MRIYIGVYGVGLGHASRMLLLADTLIRDGCTVEFSSFGDSVLYIRSNGFECNVVPEVEFGWHPSIGFNVKRSIMKIPINMVNFSRQFMLELEFMKRFRPDVVVSDTRLSTLLASYVLGIRCIVVLNQLKLLLSPRLRAFSVAKLFEDMLAESLSSLWKRGGYVIAPDLPPPYTISEQNLWDVNNIDGTLEYSGFLIPKYSFDEERIEKVRNILELSNGKRLVFIHISGPNETKLKIVKRLVEGMCILEDVNIVVSEGRPNGDSSAKRIRNGWYFEWCPFKDEIFSLCDAVIMRAGHSTIAQAIRLGKPMVCIPIENHSEQLGNAMKVSRLGIGVMLNGRDLTIKQIHHTVNDVLNGVYSRNIARVKSIAEGIDGLEYISTRIYRG